MSAGPRKAAWASPHDFIGEWLVRRHIVDHLNRTRHEFTGLAAVTATAFAERGTLRIGDAAVEASRTYRLFMDEDGVTVCFAAGHEFVRLGGAPSQVVCHGCGDDLYRGRFLFPTGDRFVEIWHVSGPRKRYASLTQYRRRNPDDENFHAPPDGLDSGDSHAITHALS